MRTRVDEMLLAIISSVLTRINIIIVWNMSIWESRICIVLAEKVQIPEIAKEMKKVTEEN